MENHMAQYQNPANGYVAEANGPYSWLWCLLFGFFYFAVKGIWTHAVIGLVLAILTSGLSWLIYPFFVYSITETHYQKLGWYKVS